MKRLLSLLLSAGMLLTLCACSIELPNINIPLFDNDITVPNEPQPPVVESDVPDEPNAPTTDENTPPPTDETELPDEPEQGTDPENNASTEQDTQQQPETPPDTPAEDEEYIRTIDPYAPMVALTFDDGPHELYSQQILDVLEQYHAVATFFEVGYNARLYPDILRRMTDLGCEIASHSNAHHDLTTLSRDAMLTDLAKLDQIIYDATGIMPTLVRPPYGAVNSTVKYESGRAMILWTVDTKDWLYRDAQVLTDYFMNYGDLDGEIVLMHSIHASTAEAMALVVPWLIEQGYQLVTVSELMAYYYGELLEANHYYNQNYFAKHARTEYPIELPAEPMQTEIPPYTVVPVVPMPKPEDTPSDTPEQPDGESSEQPPAEGSGDETPPSGDGQNTEPTPPDTEEEPTLPPDEGTIPPDAPDTGEGEDVPPTEDIEVPATDEGTIPPDSDENNTL